MSLTLRQIIQRMSLMMMLTLSACSTASEPTPAPTAPATPAEPSANTALLLPPEPSPANAESEFTTDFSRHTVPYADILSGGPPKDGIPAIDQPRYVTVAEADEWLKPLEPVVLVTVDAEARAYPLQILMWHEIVNDSLADTPLLVTFCPLCNTAIAFERAFEGQVLDFGTTGRLRFSNLIMYDRQTESWWQQAEGAGIAGQYAGAQLTLYPAAIIAWADFKAAYPAGSVLSRETGHARNYGRNPYYGYDAVTQSPFLYQGPPTPNQLLPMARVLTLDWQGEAVAYPYETLAAYPVVNDSVGGERVVVLWTPGTASALDADTVAGGRDVGTAMAYRASVESQTLTFEAAPEGARDVETGSVWNGLGQAVTGPLQGTRLSPLPAINHFWFSWAAFKPETRIYQP
jgi:hypothetical protein